ncbi:MAG: glycoside hydrolase family 88 protein [Rikenellaceae bacterium]
MNIYTKISTSLFALALAACSAETTSDYDADLYLTLASNKVLATCDNLDQTDLYPRYIDHGDEGWTLVSVDDWTSGFYPGVLWLAYEYLGDEHLLKRAEAFTAPIANIGNREPRDHDIGFMVYPSFGNGYRLTGNPKYKEIMLAAADTLATLYRPKVGAIHSWPFKSEYEHNTIIDNMMNLELLFWAAKNGGDKRLEDIAVSHAEVTQKYIVRPDSAVYHLGSFSYEGEFLRGVAHQGYADESMWARGQAWGIYGFAIAYREVGREDFLATSIKLADHFMNRLPEDGVPYWDYDDPAIPFSPKDASAAAAAASGMLEISQLVSDKALSRKYYDNAVALLRAISSDGYIAGDKCDAILDHSTGHHPKGWEIDVPIVYGDYYYLDALLKLKKITDKRNS